MSLLQESLVPVLLAILLLEKFKKLEWELKCFLFQITMQASSKFLIKTVEELHFLLSMYYFCFIYFQIFSDSQSKEIVIDKGKSPPKECIF